MELDRFEKVLKASDVKRLVVTSTMLAMLPHVDPDRDVPIRVFDNQRRQVYEFKLSGRRRGKYRMPVFQSRTWRVFEDRGIAAGDVRFFWAGKIELNIGFQYCSVTGQFYKPHLFP